MCHRLSLFPPPSFHLTNSLTFSSGEREGDRSYGGHVDTGKLDYDASAGKVDQDEKDIDCYTTTEDLEILRSPFFNEAGALAAIQKACSGPDRWQFEHVDSNPNVKDEPLYTFTVDVKKGQVWVGFDKGLCVKAFEGIVKKCEFRVLDFLMLLFLVLVLVLVLVFGE